jgi:hypothetical protein
MHKQSEVEFQQGSAADGGAAVSPTSQQLIHSQGDAVNGADGILVNSQNLELHEASFHLQANCRDVKSPKRVIGVTSSKVKGGLYSCCGDRHQHPPATPLRRGHGSVQIAKLSPF